MKHIKTKKDLSENVKHSICLFIFIFHLSILLTEYDNETNSNLISQNIQLPRAMSRDNVTLYFRVNIQIALTQQLQRIYIINDQILQ